MTALNTVDRRVGREEEHKHTLLYTQSTTSKVWQD